jgi:WD40 repeat protein
MKTKKHVGLGIFLLLFFSIIYVILAAKPLNKEYSFTPVWKISTANPVLSNNNSKAQSYFHLGQTLGYFDDDGNISLFQTFPSKASISDKYFATYNSEAKNTDFYKADGTKAGTIEASGFPYFTDNLVYIFLPGGCAFSKCSETGKILWTFEGTFPITAFVAKQKYTAVGLANGTIKVLNNENGTTEIDFAPGGSDYPVILGIDISEDGQYIASISGHNHQRFVLSHREENQQKIIYHRFFDHDSPYRTIVHFSKDGKRVFYNFYQGLGIYNLETKADKILELKDKLLSIEETDDLTILMGKDKNNYTVSIIDNTDTMEGAFSFTADSAFIRAANNNIYLGKDNSISKISITRE